MDSAYIKSNMTNKSDNRRKSRKYFFAAVKVIGELAYLGGIVSGCVKEKPCIELAGVWFPCMLLGGRPDS